MMRNLKLKRLEANKKINLRRERRPEFKVWIQIFMNFARGCGISTRWVERVDKMIDGFGTHVPRNPLRNVFL